MELEEVGLPKLVITFAAYISGRFIDILRKRFDCSLNG